MANEEQIYIEEREDGKYAIRRGRMFPSVNPHIERVRNVKTGGRDQWRDKR